MNKKDLIVELHNRTGLTKNEAEEFVNMIIEKISEALKRGENVKIENFGSFKITEKKRVQITDFSKNTRRLSNGGLKVKFIFSKKMRGFDEF